MKKLLQEIFGKSVTSDDPIRMTPNTYFFDRIRPDATEEQKFRLSTIDHIEYLERVQRRDLARLEAIKLIALLKNEFNL